MERKATEYIAAYTFDRSEPDDRIGRPGALNLGVPPEKTRFGDYWKMVGVDGRFSATARRFPGFKALDYAVSVDARTRTTAYDITQATRFHLFKQATISKGNSDHVLRGFIVVCDDYLQPTIRTAILCLFLHFDTEDNKWYTYKIAGLSGNYDDGTLAVDCASVQRLMVVTMRNDSGTALGRTVLWKYPSGGTKGVGDIVERTPGSAGAPATVFTSTLQLSTEGHILNADGPPSVQVMFRWYDPLRNLWGANIGPTTLAGTQNTRYRIKVDILNTTVDSAVEAGFSKLYCYRSIDGGGSLYLEQIVNFNTNLTDAGTDTDSITDTMRGSNNGSNDYTVYMAARSPSHAPTSNAWSLGMNDTALVLQRIYDPFLDLVGEVPLSGLLCAYKDQIVARDSITTSNRGTSSTIRWSSLFTSSPENFPDTDHVYRPTTYGSKVIDLLGGGDYAWALRGDGVVRLHRNGVSMAVNELYWKIGGLARDGSVCIGNVLYTVCPFGLMVVDGTSGRQDFVGALERLFVDPTMWGTTLSSVRLAFDSSIGALCLLNTVKEEMYLLWFGNGSLTSVSDAPFTHVTEGPDPTTGSNHYAWWLGPNGRIYRANGDFSAGRQTMCGATSNSTVNGRCLMTGISSGDKRTKFGLGAAVGATTAVAPSAVGFWVHVLSGSNVLQKRKIASITGTTPPTITVDAPFGSDLAEGDLVSIAPVVLEVGVHPIGAAPLTDLFGQKTTRVASVITRVLTGDPLEASNPGAVMRVSVHRQPVRLARTATCRVSQDSGMAVMKLNHDGRCLLPEVAQYSSDLGLELLGLELEGTIMATESETGG